MQVDPDWILRLIERLGLPLVLVLAFIKGWIVPAYVYIEKRESEKVFREITLRNAELSQRSLRAAELVVEDMRKAQ